ncbi:MAG TPA: sugar phosphate isomerase/epimerase [Victivallales bacterium]|nr:sugar phosphate isomerase/epimerase [Victivallales bacterium]HPO90769.1 sugar phosphate isomerase/epimerase [Victivallales bacterium]HRR28233.1 sugar phosphate isomerase/epimerase [Victivallales bacterium]HRU00095.1 sugar phosphate isomerase/epimerase [Victivallales bacterium]
MYYTGFADEAGKSIDIQIKATKELGWENIELRGTGFEGDLATMSDESFDKLYAKIADSGVKINCFGSGIANWGKDIKDPFENTMKEVKKSIPRMQKLGTKLVRIMSYAIRRNPDTWEVLPEQEQYFNERVKRLKEIVKNFLDAGITPVHENCMNYGGLSWQHTLRLLEAVPNLKLVYDTGNPPFSEDFSKEPDPITGRRPYQNSLEFYSKIKEHVVYVHIKDARGKAEHKKGSIFPAGQEFCFPGEGDGAVKEIIEDLLKRNYKGGLSIEPHMQVVFHEKDKKNKEEEQYKIYIEYGKRLMKIVENAKKN